MTQDTAARPSDTDLVAYLDGELPPPESVRMGQMLAADTDLKKRLDHLLAGSRPFGEAFAPLLDIAPKAQLETMLEQTLQQSRTPPQRWNRAGRLGLVAAALALLAVGAGVDRMASPRLGAPLLAANENDETAEWREAVADYLALYTRDTLARIPMQAADRDVTRAGEGLGLPLSSAKVALADLPLKRADLYDYEGQPLAFLAYLDPKQGPIALCILKGGSAAETKVEKRMDMNVVYWSNGGHSFMLIGHVPASDLQKLAAGVKARFAGEAGEAG